jgi:hypothetical protein
MASTQPVSFTSPGFDYSADVASIDRKRKLAEALQAQSFQPIQAATANGIQTPVAWTQGLAKLAEAWASGKQEKAADTEQRELAAKAQNDYRNMLTAGMSKLQGTPVSEDASGNVTPAQGPDPMGAMAAFGSHPMGQQFLPMAMQEVQRQRLAEALRGPQSTPAAPGGNTQLAGPATPGTLPAAPQGQPSGAGGPAGGIPMAAWLAQDPSGKTYLEQLAKDRAPINVRPGGTVYIPGQGAQYTAPQGGIVTSQGPSGPNASLMPGYSAAQEALHSIPNPSAPLMTVKTSSGQEIQLTQPEYVNWQKSGQLPARYGQQAPAQPPQAPLPASVPPEHAAAYKTVLDASQRGVTASAQAPAAPTGLGTVGATQSQADQIKQVREQAGGKAVDEAFAKDYVQFKAGGGAQDAQKQIAQLQDVSKALKEPTNQLTGPVRGRLPDAVRSVTNPNAVAMRERVEEVVQRSLRAILGAQFTEKEGERLIARAYNPSLSQDENAIRVNRLLTQLQDAYKVKAEAADYFEKNGTLSGWQGNCRRSPISTRRRSAMW